MITIRKPGGWISILLISTFNSLVTGYKLDYIIMQFTEYLSCEKQNCFSNIFKKKSSISFQFKNFFFKRRFKMYPRNPNKSLRKLEMERRREKATVSSSRNI